MSEPFHAMHSGVNHTAVDVPLARIKQHSRVTIVATWLYLTAVRLAFTLIAMLCAVFYTLYDNILHSIAVVLRCGGSYKWNTQHIQDATQQIGTQQYPYRVCIIGAGLSGVCMAMQLVRNSTREFILYESSSTTGGTWASNQWVGSECDIQSLLYSYSFVTDFAWQSQYASYAEICSYIQHCIDKYQLQPYTHCRTTVTNIHWLDEQHMYQITTVHKSGAVSTVYAKYVVNACGVLRQPHIPHIPQSHLFQGQSFHSARFDHSVELRNKSVAVIGTGASAVSLATALPSRCKQLYIYQRTPQYIVPRMQYRFSAARQFVYRYIPLVQKLTRTVQYFFNDSIVLGSRYKLFSINESLQRLSIDYMLSQTHHNTVLQHQLLPQYTIGCKRILLSDTFYYTVQQPNVQLISSSIKCFTHHSIVTDNNETHNVDVVIYCTGFDVYASNIKVTGLPHIDSVHSSMYRGVTQLHRPNMFHILGFNTVVSHNSTVVTIEAACKYVIAAMQYCNKHRIKSVLVKADTVVQYNEYIQREIAAAVFSTQSDCTSWFMTGAGDQSVNTASWPLFAYNYYTLMRSFDPHRYDCIR